MKTTTPSPNRTRMSAEDRRKAIINAVMPVFANKGFAATTTKDLAQAAGISEALLYRHFPSKESLYEDIQNQICSTESSIHDYILTMEPGSKGIVKIIYLIFKIIFETQKSHPHNSPVCRLMIQSFLEDGDFARSFIEPRFQRMLPYMEMFVEEARAAGEMVDSPVTAKEMQWFSHHLAVSLRLAHLPEEKVFDYDSSPPERLLHAVWFSLRGLGLKDEVISKIFAPEEFEAEIEDVLVRAGLFIGPESS